MPILALLIVLTLPAFAEAEPPAAELQNAEPPTEYSDTHRENSWLSINYNHALLGFIVANKHGLELAYVANAKWSWGIEYFKGSYGLSTYGLDIASFDETLYLAHGRYYFFDTFNMTAGVGQRQYELKLGDDVIKKTSGYDKSEMSLLKVTNEVIHLGVGNRWLFKNGITVGGDWLTVDIPVGKGRVKAPVLEAIESEKTRDKVGDLLSTLRYFPTIAALKFNIGYVF